MDRSGEVEALVLACYESWRTGDIAVFESLLANDETVLMVGTDPEEWWSGPNAVIEALRSLLPQTADLELLPGHPQAFESGDVAWFADRAAWVLPNRTEVPFRMTGVVIREAGGWKMLQTHLSIGVANEDVIGRELPV
jgi:ketosteroid isomerase-like protein